MTPLRSPLPRALPALALAVALLVAACSGSEPSPAEARRDRLDQRLRSFSEAQASCIVDRLDAKTLIALDKTTGLAGDDAAQEDYSDAVVTCVTDPEAGATTTTVPSTTTTAPG